MLNWDLRDEEFPSIGVWTVSVNGADEFRKKDHDVLEE